MSNILDMLLGADMDNVKKPRQELEIGRLSKALGEKFILICEALSPDKFDEIQENSLQITGKDVDLDINKMQLFAIVEGVVTEDGKCLFKNKELQKKFKAPTSLELVKKLLLPGEINKVYTTISDLSGFGDKAVEEVKN